MLNVTRDPVPLPFCVSRSTAKLFDTPPAEFREAVSRLSEKDCRLAVDELSGMLQAASWRYGYLSYLLRCGVNPSEAPPGDLDDAGKRANEWLCDIRKLLGYAFPDATKLFPE